MYLDTHQTLIDVKFKFGLVIDSFEKSSPSDSNSSSTITISSNTSSTSTSDSFETTKSVCFRQKEIEKESKKPIELCSEEETNRLKEKTEESKENDNGQERKRSNYNPLRSSFYKVAKAKLNGTLSSFYNTQHIHENIETSRKSG